MFFYLVDNLHRTEAPKLLQPRFQLEARSLVFMPFHFLFDVFNKKLQQYVEANLCTSSLSYFDERNSIKRYEQFKEAFSVLTLSELKAGFVVCLVPLILCIFVFGMEWMIALKDLLLFLLIFKTYFDLKESEQLEYIDIIKIKMAAWHKALRSKLKMKSFGTEAELGAPPGERQELESAQN